MARGAAISVRGLQHTLRALSVIDPEQMKAFRRGFKDATQPIIDKAKRRVPAQPMSGWGTWSGRLDWDSNRVKRGLKSQVSVTKRRAILRLRSNDAAGAVFENAGSKSPSSPFVRGLVASAGKNGFEAEQPRLLVRTWKEEKGIKSVYKAVDGLIEDAVNRVASAVR